VATNRRERLREATMNEIRAAALAQLSAGGPGAISLRAIARDMGLTAAALYRYYDSLESLTEDLCADRYRSMTHAVVTARDTQTDCVSRLRAMCLAYREWALSHPQEYALICGAPVLTGDAPQEGPAVEKTAAAVEFTLVFLGPFAEAWAGRRTPPPTLLPGVLESLDGPVVEFLSDKLTPEGVVYFVNGWARLSGAITTEIFGHLRWAASDAEPLFRENLEDMLRQLTD
jgi:AcrR family transcriptional regulator